MSKKTEEDEENRAQSFYKKFTNQGPSYFGDLDEQDGKLLEYERHAEEEGAHRSSFQHRRAIPDRIYQNGRTHTTTYALRWAYRVMSPYPQSPGRRKSPQPQYWPRQNRAHQCRRIPTLSGKHQMKMLTWKATITQRRHGQTGKRTAARTLRRSSHGRRR